MSEKNFFLLPVIAAILFCSIFLWHFGLWLPNGGDTIFIILLLGALGYYRPGWAFVVGIGCLPLEMISFAPESYGATLRLSLICAIAAVGGWTMHALRTEGFVASARSVRARLGRIDVALIILMVGAFISMSTSTEDVVILWKHIFILISLGVIYISTRIACAHSHVRRLIPYALAVGGVLTACYGILQNIFYLTGQVHREVMPGRPNATFAEADWLGIYLIIPIVIMGLWCIVMPTWTKGRLRLYRFLWRCFCGISLIALFVALLLSVARSAWIGVAVACLMLYILLWRTVSVRHALGSLALYSGSVIVAYMIISATQLSPFVLGERAASTGGLQEITIACTQESITLPQQIEHVDQLTHYNCQHIDLEAIAQEKARGQHVTTVLRPDPTITVRKSLYTTALTTIGAHPFTGVGWGRSGEFLGQDENGHAHNSANIVLQIMLGSGALGLVSVILIMWSMVTLWIAIIRREVHYAQRHIWSITLLSICGGVVAANMFNAGFLQGYMWVLLAMLQAAVPSKKYKSLSTVSN